MVLLVFLLLPILTLGVTTDFEAKCNDLANVRFADTSIAVTYAEYLPTGSVIDLKAYVHETCTSDSPPAVSSKVCRVGLRMATSTVSSVTMEAWLPELWEKRFLQMGNSGVGGCIDYPQLAYGASLGFASVAHNNGFNGTSLSPLSKQPEVLKDFSWRAMWLSAVVGKALTAYFYEHSPQNFKSYHMGCGDGGRQGFRAAQSHPDLFDGIIAGAPAINTDMLAMWYAHALATLGLDESSSTYLRPQDWELIYDEVVRQCDSLDGATDGILEDTRTCKLDTSRLYCWSGRCPDGLTYQQIFAMEQIFLPFKHGDYFLHPGAAHGNEIALAELLYSGAAKNAVTEWYRYIFPGDLKWELENFESVDGSRSIIANPGELHTFNPDLGAFRDRGGKILHWHGQSDTHISISNSDYYYDLVLNTTSPNGTDTSALDDWYRYYRLSGTEHCGGGPGAHFIGQHARGKTDGIADNNVLLAMVAWVESGVQPESLRGVKWRSDDPVKGVDFSRKHCKHPRVGVYKGEGNGNDEDGWKCVEK